jgi:protoporphyrin/coproporphyrin ferrochelatase
VKRGVLLLAHGAPERVEDIESYLAYVRSARPGAGPTPKSVVDEVTGRYQEIGGSSPLTAWTRKQAESLERLLGIPVFVGMRNWHPFIAETLARVRDAGIERLAAICMAPQYSIVSVGLYMRRTEQAKKELGLTTEVFWAKSYHDEPLLIEAFAERIEAAMRQRLRDKPPGQSGGIPRFLFTAHSVPEAATANGDPYREETHATAAAVAARLNIQDWDLAYQSQGMTGERWLGPTVESRLDSYAAEGLREVVVDPIGFVCDHVEILYDIDILFRRYAAERGISLFRPESLNDSPKYTAALAEVAKRCLGEFKNN